MSSIITTHNITYNLRSHHKLVVPCFNTYYMKNSIAHSGSIAWNALTSLYLDVNSTRAYAKKVKKSNILKKLDFNIESPQTIGHMDDCFIVY